MPGLRNCAVVLALIAPVALAAAPAAAQSSACKRAGSATIAENNVARVLTRLDPDPDWDGGRTLLFGCFKRNGRMHELADAVDEFDFIHEFTSVRLRGRFVAWYAEHLEGCRYGCTPQRTLETIDLRSGEVKSVYLSEPPAGAALVLDAYGDIAWPVWMAHNQIELRARDALGERVIDTGAIHPESLRVSSQRSLEWRKDGMFQSAGLEPPPPDTTAPDLGGLSVTVHRIEYTLSEYAMVRFTIRRRKGGRSVPLKGSFTRYGDTGPNRVYFDGRLRGRKLKRGQYTLVAWATDYANHRAISRRTNFTIPSHD